MTDQTTQYQQVTVYTDGACCGNPGPGGYGCLLRCGGRTRELSGGYRKTTNNRMELMAAIRALEMLKKPCHVELFSDSRYLVESMTKGWAKRWRSNGWMRNKEELALNSDLWAMLLDLCEKHPTKFIWVKGHASNPDNNRCDKLATDAARRPDLPVDEEYEKNALVILPVEEVDFGAAPDLFNF